MGGGGPRTDAEDAGLGPVDPRVLRRFATEGTGGVLAGAGGTDLALGGNGGAADVGGLGADVLGGPDSGV